MGGRGRLARVGWSAALVVSLGVTPAVAGGSAAQERGPDVGSAGVGDRYFPTDGNGGYDVVDYDLALRYQPGQGRLNGVATMRATATQPLSRFNLDLRGLTVRGVEVDGVAATWRRRGNELIVSAPAPLAARVPFVVVTRYDGKPAPYLDQGERLGFLRTADGAVVTSEPQGAGSWFPANDHPRDAATYTERISVPTGLTAVGNGVLVDQRPEAGWTTWTWRAEQPMASYLATIAIGDFDLRSGTYAGLPYWNAVDRALLQPYRPRTGARFARTGQGASTFQRLTRAIRVPKSGGRLSFWVNRATEPGNAPFFVEARTLGRSDWTTLRDRNGHTSSDPGDGCPGRLDAHPFLRHYLSTRADTCTSRGSTGAWWSATGLSRGYENWSVDLSRFAGRTAQISLSYLSGDVNLPGVFIDDLRSSTGSGSTSFEADTGPGDGWHPSRPPGETARAHWRFGTAAQAPPPLGEVAARALDRQGEIIAFLARRFGPYPFAATGGIVHLADSGFSLETQTRPIYVEPRYFSSGPEARNLIVHELSHQWFGDSLRLRNWSDIWLNEGFATYGEFLWNAQRKRKARQASFGEVWKIPASDPFWKLAIGTPGPEHLFDEAIYYRGAATLHQLRLLVGPPTFAAILREWAQRRAATTVTTRQFIALAEKISHRDLNRFFRVWLFTRSKPKLPGPGGPAPR